MNKKHFLFLKRTSFRRPVNHNTIHQSQVFPSGLLVPVGWLHRGWSPVGGALSTADGVGHREHEPMFNVQEPFETLHRCDVRRPSQPSLRRAGPSSSSAAPPTCHLEEHEHNHFQQLQQGAAMQTHMMSILCSCYQNRNFQDIYMHLFTVLYTVCQIDIWLFE